MNMNRNKIAGILALMVMVIAPKAAFAEWKIYYTGQAARMFGTAGRGSFATQAECEAYRAKSPPAERNNCHCAGSDGPGGAVQFTPEQQFALGLLGGLLKSVFAKPDTSRQAEIERQNELQRLQAEEQERQLLKEQELARQKMFDEEKSQLLDSFKDTRTDALDELKGGSEATSELQLKTPGTDNFRGDAVDLRGKQGIVGSLKASEEQAELERSPAAWNRKEGELIQQRLQEPNKWCDAICTSLKTNAPPPPDKQWDELQPGDVLLLEGKAIAYVDNKFSSGANASNASHTVIFLKEVNGKKLFLDNQPFQGPRIISEDEYLKLYGSRGTEVAKLVGQPLNPKETKALFTEAVKKAQANRQELARNWFGTPLIGTNYGAWGKDDVVCSEVDWALINATGRSIPKSDDQLKVKLGIDFSPADYKNSQYFLVTRMDIVPGYASDEK
jgi:hypothetical protein